MNRSVFAPALTLLFCSAFVSGALAQAKPAVAQAKAPAPAAPAPPAKAGFITPLKGEGTVQVVPGVSKFDPKTKEVVTTYKIKNTSSAPIALLKLDEYWYEKSGKMVSTDTQRYRQPFQPGTIVELTTHAPAPGNPAGWNKNVTFSHANGKITAKKVDKF